jgi:hypothetical protein
LVEVDASLKDRYAFPSVSSSSAAVRPSTKVEPFGSPNSRGALQCVVKLVNDLVDASVEQDAGGSWFDEGGADPLPGFYQLLQGVPVVTDVGVGYEPKSLASD